jgi:hypothetical protein
MASRQTTPGERLPASARPLERWGRRRTSIELGDGSKIATNGQCHMTPIGYLSSLGCIGVCSVQGECGLGRFENLNDAQAIVAIGYRLLSGADTVDEVLAL